MAMIMIMGLMTYSKFNTYRVQATLQYHFENFIQNNEREYFNDSSKERYDSTHVRSKGENGANERKSERNTSSSKLPIGVLLERSQQSVGTEKYETVRLLLKNLILNLYGNQSFLSGIIKNRPDSIDEIINRLPDAVQRLPTNQKITKPKDLANLDLEDDTLNELLYKFLKGTQFLYETKKGIVEEGYPSLIEFINTGKAKKIRVYLAPKEVLHVIFDEGAVDEIIRSREHYYLEVINDRMNSQEATEKFKTLFEGALSPIVTPDFVDFTVSKSDPRKR